jgi:magnesium-transporting ATPase (P-type)
MIRNPFAKDIEQISKELQTDPERGLEQAEVETRLKEYGQNALQPLKPRKWWLILSSQFLDPIIYILLIATTLALFYGSTD